MYFRFVIFLLPDTPVTPVPIVEKWMRVRKNIIYKDSEDESTASDDNTLGPYPKRLKRLAKRGKWASFYTNERKRNQDRWTNATPEQKDRNRELSRERMKKKRERDRACESQIVSRSAKKKLEMEKEKQRAYWRIKKKDQRARKKIKSATPALHGESEYNIN